MFADGKARSAKCEKFDGKTAAMKILRPTGRRKIKESEPLSRSNLSGVSCLFIYLQVSKKTMERRWTMMTEDARKRKIKKTFNRNLCGCGATTKRTNFTDGEMTILGTGRDTYCRYWDYR